jgi:hypothetical protein
LIIIVKNFGGEQNMNKKIVGILVCTLLISTAAFSIAVNVKNINTSSRGWTETQKIITADGALDDRFGCAVEIDGDSAIIGAYFDDVNTKTNAGSAYVFVRSGSTWTQQAKLTASDGDTDDEFGFSVAIDGDTAIVGSPMDDDLGASSGSAYIFIRTGSAWSLQQKILHADGATGDEFGRSVSIDEDYVIVGAPRKNSEQGFSYIFKRSANVWTQMTKVGATGSNKLGWSVSISMPCVAMGAFGTNNNIGAAYIYELVGSSWMGRGTYTASDGATMDLFGTSVAIYGDHLVCGAPGHDHVASGAGATFVFEKAATGWATMTETQEITASDAAGSDGFGKSVSVDGNNIIVSSPDDDDKGLSSGSAYIFSRGTSTWTEVAKLLASDGLAQDYLGWGVSVDGNSAIAGAYAEDNTNGNEAGSAYLFDWSNQAPTPPVITGPTNGNAGTSYPYTFTSTDGDGDQVSYYVEWGDTTNTGWFGPFASGATQTKSHSWTSQGTYTIKAKAKDTNGAESAFNTYSVTMPREKALISPLLRFLQGYPNFLPIFRQLFGL